MESDSIFPNRAPLECPFNFILDIEYPRELRIVGLYPLPASRRYALSPAGQGLYLGLIGGFLKGRKVSVCPGLSTEAGLQ